MNQEWWRAFHLWVEWTVMGAFINAGYIVYTMWRGYLK